MSRSFRVPVSRLDGPPFSPRGRKGLTMALSKELPEEVELCRRCGAGLVFHLPGGEKKQAYCPKCGAKEPGVLYVRKDVAVARQQA